VVLPYLNRARLSYATRAFYSTGGFSLLPPTGNNSAVYVSPARSGGPLTSPHNVVALPYPVPTTMNPPILSFNSFQPV
jgi:hypothetical protein